MAGKGRIKTGGRVAGTPNVATHKARTVLAEFVESNVENMQSWIEEIALEDKKEAFRILNTLMEYHIPKLARTETTVSGPDGGPVEHSLKVNFGD